MTGLISSWFLFPILLYQHILPHPKLTQSFPAQFLFSNLIIFIRAYYPFLDSIYPLVLSLSNLNFPSYYHFTTLICLLNSPLSWKLRARRFLAHLIVLLLVAASAYAVTLLVDRSEGVSTSSSWWRQNELTIVLALISNIYPNLFDVSTSTVFTVIMIK